MRLPLRLLLQLHICIFICLSFVSSFRYITTYLSKIFVFSQFLTTTISFEALAKGVPWDLLYEIWSQKTRVRGLPEGENCMILRLLVLSQCQRVTDSIAEHNKNESNNHLHVEFFCIQIICYLN